MNVAKIDGESLTSDDLVRWLKLSGRFPHVIQDLIKEKLAATAARKQGVEVPVDELQARADQHRRTLGLHRAKDANQFLDDAGVSLDQYERYLEDGVLSDKMRATLTSDSAVEAYFKLNSPQYDSIEVSHIVVDNEGKAKEIASILQDDPDSFTDMAQQHSLADTAGNGGRIGKVYRGALNPDIEAKLFNATEREMLGPFASDDGATHEIFTINAKTPASLDGEASATICTQIYNEWLESRAREHKVEI